MQRRHPERDILNDRTHRMIVILYYETCLLPESFEGFCYTSEVQSRQTIIAANPPLRKYRGSKLALASRLHHQHNHTCNKPPWILESQLLFSDSHHDLDRSCNGGMSLIPSSVLCDTSMVTSCVAALNNDTLQSSEIADILCYN